MIKNPHLVCERVLNTLKVSGLTYSLTETPFSCNIELRKKYVNNFVPQPDFNVMNYEVNCTVNTTATKQESAIKSEQDTVKELRAVRNSLFESEKENTNLRETLGQLQCSSSAREKSLITESSNVKEEFAAEIEICSMMKTRYDQLVLTSGQKTDSLLESENETRNLREALEQLQCSSLARESDLTSELLKVKEVFTAEIEKSSMMKIRYDQLVLISGQKIDSLKNALESIKAEMTVETLKLKKCRKGEKSLSKEGVKLCEEIKDTKASSNIKHDDMKTYRQRLSKP